MRKTFLVFALLLISLSFASAHDSHTINLNDDYTYKEKISATKYYPQDDYSVTITRYANYDNDDRYSTDDYRNGYSYRKTKPYWEDHYDDEITRSTYEEKYYTQEAKYDYKKYSDYDNHDRNYDDYDHRRSRRYRDAGPSYSVKYVSYLRDYKVAECHDRPPRGQLFYIAC